MMALGAPAAIPGSGTRRGRRAGVGLHAAATDWAIGGHGPLQGRQNQPLAMPRRGVGAGPTVAPA